MLSIPHDNNVIIGRTHSLYGTWTREGAVEKGAGNVVANQDSPQKREKGGCINTKQTNAARERWKKERNERKSLLGDDKHIIFIDRSIDR